MPRTDVANPFVYSRALSPAEAIPRPDEVDALLGRLEGGHNLTLHAARRMGKTSLLKQLALTAEGRRLLVVSVDMSDVLSVADVAIRLEQAYRSLPGRTRRVVSRELGALGVSTPVGGLTVQRRGPPDALATVHSLLELPVRVAERTGRKVLVVLDEFQALIELPGLDGVFRSHLQHHASVSYVFCGSEPSLLRGLFEDRARPLFGQAEQIRLERPEFESAHDFVVRRFEETGKDAGELAAELVHASELHPQRLMLLAHFVWEQTGAPRAGISDLRLGYDAAARAASNELRYLWDGLTANERRVLRAVASGLSPYQAEARVLAGLASASSAQRAVDSLLGRAVVERDAPPGLRIVDPFLGRWVRRHGGAGSSIYVVPASAGGFVVTDGPSLAFARAECETLAEAEAEADRLAASSPAGTDVMIFDTEDPNDLPDWAVG
jgi:hypothetical protein